MDEQHGVMDRMAQLIESHGEVKKKEQTGSSHGCLQCSASLPWGQCHRMIVIIISAIVIFRMLNLLLFVALYNHVMLYLITLFPLIQKYLSNKDIDSIKEAVLKEQSEKVVSPLLKSFHLSSDFHSSSFFFVPTCCELRYRLTLLRLSFVWTPDFSFHPPTALYTVSFSCYSGAYRKAWSCCCQTGGWLRKTASPCHSEPRSEHLVTLVCGHTTRIKYSPRSIEVHTVLLCPALHVYISHFEKMSVPDLFSNSYHQITACLPRVYLSDMTRSWPVVIFWPFDSIDCLKLIFMPPCSVTIPRMANGANWPQCINFPGKGDLYSLLHSYPVVLYAFICLLY